MPDIQRISRTFFDKDIGNVAVRLRAKDTLNNRAGSAPAIYGDESINIAEE